MITACILGRFSQSGACARRKQIWKAIHISGMPVMCISPISAPSKRYFAIMQQICRHLWRSRSGPAPCGPRPISRSPTVLEPASAILARVIRTCNAICRVTSRMEPNAFDALMRIPTKFCYNNGRSQSIWLKSANRLVRQD